MNAAALPIIEALARNGEALNVLFGALNVQDHYGDGASLYAYQASNPVNRLDALGLDLGDDIDDLVADMNGERAAAGAAVAAQMGQIFNTAAFLGQMAFSFMPGADAIKLVYLITQGRAGDIGWKDVLGAGLSLSGPLGKIAGRFGGMLIHYAGRGLAGKMVRSGDDVVRAFGKACNCFVSATLVDTQDGMRPIESICVGDQVLTKPDVDALAPARPGRVTRVFMNLAPVVVWLTLASGDVVGTTPGHEVWTFQDGWTYAGRLEPGDTLQNESGARVDVLDIFVDDTPTVVYNLEVDGTFTYFAQGVWVHNNSCDLARLGRVNNAYGHSFEVAVQELFGLRKYGGPKLTAAGTNFVPDFLGNGIIGDIKGGEYVCQTPQLAAIVSYAKENGLKPVLYATGKVSKWVSEHFEVVVVP
jgi:hypothetical protein